MGTSTRLDKTIVCDYCGKTVPKWRPSAKFGFAKLVEKLPNGLWRCLICRDTRS